jgi:hypothetical protein
MEATAALETVKIMFGHVDLLLPRKVIDDDASTALLSTVFLNLQCD